MSRKGVFTQEFSGFKRREEKMQGNEGRKAKVLKVWKDPNERKKSGG